MKKTLITAITLACAFALQAQTSPETIMSWCPALPSEADMIRFETENLRQQTLSQPDLYDDFADALKTARSKANAVIEKESASIDKVMASKTSGTDLTVAQASQLSEAQARQLAQNKMTSTMTGLGLSAEDMARMQSGDLSEAEQMALANKVMMAQTGGISMEDIQRMEHMSDAERAQYMQQHQNKGNIDAKMQQNQKNLQKSQQVNALIQQMLEYDRQAQAYTDKRKNFGERAKEQGRALYNKQFKQRYDALEATAQQAIQDGALSEKYSEEEAPKVEAAAQRLEAVRKQQTDLTCEFYRQYIPMYRKAVADQMAQCKNTFLPVMKSKKQVMDQLYQLTGDAQYAITNIYPFTAASDYLEIAEELADYALEF